MSVNSERRDGNCVREDVQVKILIFLVNFEIFFFFRTRLCLTVTSLPLSASGRRWNNNQNPGNWNGSSGELEVVEDPWLPCAWHPRRYLLIFFTMCFCVFSNSLLWRFSCVSNVSRSNKHNPLNFPSPTFSMIELIDKKCNQHSFSVSNLIELLPPRLESPIKASPSGISHKAGWKASSRKGWTDSIQGWTCQKAKVWSFLQMAKHVFLNVSFLAIGRNKSFKIQPGWEWLVEVWLTSCNNHSWVLLQVLVFRYTAF